MTSLSKHSMMNGVSATMQLSFGNVTLFFLGTGRMVISLKQEGTTAWDTDRLKMSEKTPVSWPTRPSWTAAL